MCLTNFKLSCAGLPTGTILKLIAFSFTRISQVATCNRASTPARLRFPHVRVNGAKRKVSSFRLQISGRFHVACGQSCHFKEGSSRFLFHGKPLHSATHLRYGSGPYRTRKMSPGSPLPSVSKLNQMVWIHRSYRTSQFHPCEASKTDPFR